MVYGSVIFLVVEYILGRGGYSFHSCSRSKLGSQYHPAGVFYGCRAAFVASLRSIVGSLIIGNSFWFYLALAAPCKLAEMSLFMYP